MGPVDLKSYWPTQTVTGSNIVKIENMLLPSSFMQTLSLSLLTGQDGELVGN